MSNSRPMEPKSGKFIIISFATIHLLLPDHPSQDATYPAHAFRKQKRSKETKRCLAI